MLSAEGVSARVVSMPSWELFAAQEEAYRDEVLPPGVPKVSVEAAISMGWERWVDRVGVDRALRRLGSRAARCSSAWGSRGEHVAQVARELLGR